MHFQVLKPWKMKRREKAVTANPMTILNLRGINLQRTKAMTMSELLCLGMDPTIQRILAIGRVGRSGWQRLSYPHSL